MSPADVEPHLVRLESLFTLLPDVPRVYAEWHRLVIDYDVRGVQVHDARIAAAMMVYGVSHILTLNPTDFRRYDGITAIDPREMM